MAASLDASSINDAKHETMTTMTAHHSKPSTHRAYYKGPLRSATQVNGYVRLEIGIEKMHRLLACHHICAGDFRCMDHASKICIKELFLRTLSEQIDSFEQTDLKSKS